MNNISNSELIRRFIIEKEKFDRSGIYGYTQRTLAYNSNRIEGSTLTKEQTASLFEEGVLTPNNNIYRAKDVEEMNGHFLMFNYMLSSLNEPLTEEMIKRFHYELKSGVFEDRANGYAIGEYKTRANMVGTDMTALPDEVPGKMSQLLSWYTEQAVTIETLAEFHVKYETIHPFQDGNGRTGRIILFRECLINDISPFIIEDENRYEYISGLKTGKTENDYTEMIKLFIKEQKVYEKYSNLFLAKTGNKEEL